MTCIRTVLIPWYRWPVLWLVFSVPTVLAANFTTGAADARKFGTHEIVLTGHGSVANSFDEQDHGHYDDPGYFFRWLFWSWTLSGGSANYCGRWGPIHPYSMTARPDLPWTGIDKKTVYTGEQLVGLDSVSHITRYFGERQIDIALFKPDDGRVKDLDGRTGRLRPKLMRRGNEEFIIYHPNAAADNKAARVDEGGTARMRVDLSSATGTFQVEWYRALDGVKQAAGRIEGGAEQELTAPWKGQDVVLRLRVNP